MKNKLATQALQRIFLGLALLSFLGVSCKSSMPIPSEKGNITNVVTVTTSVSNNKNECGEDLACLRNRLQDCGPSKGILRNSSHRLEYTIVGIQKDENESPFCEVDWKQISVAKNEKIERRSKCIISLDTDVDRQIFFEKWIQKEFNGSLMAYCNPRTKHEVGLDTKALLDVPETAEWNWECIFPGGLECMTDVAP